MAQFIPCLVQIPEVPGFFRARFQTGVPDALIYVSVRSGLITTVRLLGQLNNETKDLQTVLHSVRQKYLAQDADMEVFDEPRTILSPSWNSPEHYRIIMLARGLIVAYSDYFVAVFDFGHNAWFVFAVAVTGGRYFRIRLRRGERIQGILKWCGRGLEMTTIVHLDLLPYAMPAYSPRFLMNPRYMADPEAVINFWVCGGPRALWAAIERHTLRYVHSAGPWGWRVETCLDNSHGNNCPYRGRRIQVLPPFWRVNFADD